MNRPHFSHWLTFATTCCITVILVAGCADRAKHSEPVFEDIIITAHKRPPNVMDVPVSVTVITAAELEAAGIKDIFNMQEITPGQFAGSSKSDTSGALASAQPGEELWIISTPRVDASNTDDDDDPGSGAMVANFASADEQPDAPPLQVPLPLKHTSVRAVIDGYVGTVDVSQKFENPFAEKIEAVYLFPLPQNAAISEFTMTIGDRRIRGILREKEEAEEIYRQARDRGYQASLLVQHRPNIFEQKVANIEPGKSIDVDIRYFHTLAYIDGWYSFVFPTVVGPRFNPPNHDDPIHALPREEVDAPKDGTAIRYLRPQERSAHDISIHVEINAGVEIEGILSSHKIRQTSTGSNSATVELASQSTIPNRDFILSFQVAGKTMKSGLLTYKDPNTNQGYFTLMMYPPAGLQELARQPMEMVFVMDCSGSMHGKPLSQAKSAVLAALDQLRENDTFQIIRFSSSASKFGAVPVPATRENIQVAKNHVRKLKGSGGTMMIEGLKAALDFPHDPQRLRFVTFLTDGYIGNETDIIGAVHDRIGDARIFSFGVGSSVNRYLLERMASTGRGAVAYLGLDDSGKKIMTDFFDRISHPVMTDVDIDWGNTIVSDVYPAQLPDMFVGRPVVVTGKFDGAIGDPVVRGQTIAAEHQFALASNEDTQKYPFIPKIWARLRIADLSDRQTWTHNPDELGIEIRSTALEYGLMSQYTSFVAVDASQVTDGSHGTTVHQSVPVPVGVKYETTVDQ